MLLLLNDEPPPSFRHSLAPALEHPHAVQTLCTCPVPTHPTISSTRSHWPLPTWLGPRHAAPMQNRVLPAALARSAAWREGEGNG